MQNPNDFDSGCYLHPWGIGTNAAGAQTRPLELPLPHTSPSRLSNGRLLTASTGAAGERLLASAQQGLQLGLAPQLSLEGSGGTYLLRDARRQPLAAFKPRDEEPFAPNNPRGLQGKMGQEGIHPNVASGDAHIREVLAFRLDWGGFASVPCTLQVEGRHPALKSNHLEPLSRYGAKVGSLQEWVRHDDIAADRGNATFPAHEVHKIALLDMRLLNTDRHDSNMLVVDLPDDGVKLVPIDHGGCLPSRPEAVWYNWCWLSWPQMKVPLSAADVAYVASLDVAAEAKLLTELGVPPRPRRVCHCATMLLQRGVAAGLSLLEVASLMCREEEEVPSELERLWEQAERLAYSALHNHRLRGCSSDAAITSTSACSTCTSTTTTVPSSSLSASKDSAATADTSATAATTTTTTTSSSSSAAAPKSSSSATSSTATVNATTARACSAANNIPDEGASARRPLPPERLDSPPPPSGSAAQPSTATTTQQRPVQLVQRAALTGIKRVTSTSTLVDFARHQQLAADDSHAALDEAPLLGYPRHGRASAASSQDRDPGGAAEATFLAYFERMLDDMVERQVALKERKAPAAPKEPKSPRTSLGPDDSPAVAVKPSPKPSPRPSASSPVPEEEAEVP